MGSTCQQVKYMRISEEYFDLDVDDDVTISGLAPNVTTDSVGHLHLDICYYEGKMGMKLCPTIRFQSLTCCASRNFLLLVLLNTSQQIQCDITRIHLYKSLVLPQLGLL